MGGYGSGRRGGGPTVESEFAFRIEKISASNSTAAIPMIKNANASTSTLAPDFTSAGIG